MYMLPLGIMYVTTLEEGSRCQCQCQCVCVNPVNPGSLLHNYPRCCRHHVQLLLAVALARLPALLRELAVPWAQLVSRMQYRARGVQQCLQSLLLRRQHGVLRRRPIEPALMEMAPGSTAVAVAVAAKVSAHKRCLRR